MKLVLILLAVPWLSIAYAVYRFRQHWIAQEEAKRMQRRFRQEAS